MYGVSGEMFIVCAYGRVGNRGEVGLKVKPLAVRASYAPTGGSGQVAYVHVLGVSGC